MVLQLSRRLFTIDEYHQMAQAGVLHEDDRVELLDGEIIEMSPIGSRHAACVARLTAVFSRYLQTRAIVWGQNPVRLGDRSEPQPDLALLRPKSDYYASAHPSAAEVLLLVEVADSSLELDRDIKVPLYARAGVQEVWLIDLTASALTVYREPSLGAYRTEATFGRGDQVQPQAFSDLTLEVADLLA
jgi:Uma2 family endonuclease